MRRRRVWAAWLQRRPLEGAAQGGRLKTAERAAFMRQLAGLVGAGVPLVNALDVISRSTTQAPFVRLAQALRLDVATGHSLSHALGRHPRIFSAQTCRLVEAGESAGLLEQTLARVAEQDEKAARLQRQMRAALAYPAAVVVIAAVVVAVIMTQVVPTFRDVFASFGAELPPLTRAVMGASDTLQRHGLWLIATLALGAGVTHRALSHTARRRRWRDAQLMRLPVWGSLLQRVAMARWARTFSSVFGAGLTVVQALTHAGQSCGNAAVAQATLEAQTEVANGQPLAASLAQSGLFTPLVIQMASIGEASGSLEQMLARAASVLEDEVDAAVQGASSLMEPLIISVLGLVLGTVVVALYLPILQLGSIA